jgi:hypothetical protein
LVALARGEFDEAARLLDEAGAIAHESVYADLAIVAVNRAHLEVARRDWTRGKEFARSALATAEDFGNAGIAASCRRIVALSLIAQERHDEAEALLGDAFDGAVARRRTMLGDVLDAFAAVCAARGAQRAAATLIGSADTARRENGGMSHDDGSQWLRDQTVARSREALGGAEFDAAVAEGAALSLEAVRKLVH